MAGAGLFRTRLFSSRRFGLKALLGGVFMVYLFAQQCHAGLFESWSCGETPEHQDIVGYSTTLRTNPATSAPASPGRQQETRYRVTIRYSDERDLPRFVSRLRTGFPGFLARWSGASPEALLGEALERVDQLVERVETLLDLRVSGGGTTLLVTTDHETLREISRKMYGRNMPDHKAFFAPGRNLMVVSASDITPNMLAHELAHAMMYAYFGETPVPAGSQEVLAQYVDTHLYDR